MNQVESSMELKLYSIDVRKYENPVGKISSMCFPSFFLNCSSKL